MQQVSVRVSPKNNHNLPLAPVRVHELERFIKYVCSEFFPSGRNDPVEGRLLNEDMVKLAFDEMHRQLCNTPSSNGISKDAHYSLIDFTLDSYARLARDLYNIQLVDLAISLRRSIAPGEYWCPSDNAPIVFLGTLFDNVILEKMAAEVPQAAPAAEVPQAAPAAEVPQAAPAAEVPQAAPVAEVPVFVEPEVEDGCIPMETTSRHRKNKR